MMGWSDVNSWLYGIFAMLVGGVVYLVRSIFTNQKQIDMLKQKLDLQEQHRMERDKRFEEQLLEIRTDLKALMKHQM